MELACGGGVGGRIVMGHPVHIHSVHVYRYCKILGLNLELTAKNCIYDSHIHLVLNKRLFKNILGNTVI